MSQQSTSVPALVPTATRHTAPRNVSPVASKKRKSGGDDNDNNQPASDHRKRRRNRTTQSCLNCHASKRMVGNIIPLQLLNIK